MQGSAAEPRGESLTAVLDAGELLLQNGAEVSRVEDTIQRLGRRCGFVRVDVFTITSSIVVTARRADGECFTQTRRIRSRNTDLGKVEQVNALSRRYCAGQLPPDAFAAALDRVRTAPPAPVWMPLLLYMGISCSLSVFFGGNGWDGAAAALSGMVLFSMICLSDTLQMNSLLQTVVCSAVTAATVLLLVRVGLGVHPDKIMIGNIMLLIPGLQLTSSLRDMINGDTISGLLTLSEALLKAVSVALGFSLVLFAGGAV